MRLRRTVVNPLPLISAGDTMSSDRFPFLGERLQFPRECVLSGYDPREPCKTKSSGLYESLIHVVRIILKM